MGSSHGKSLETEKGILCKTSMKDILVIPEVNKEEKLLSRKFVEHGHFLYEDQTGLSLKLEITKTVYSLGLGLDDWTACVGSWLLLGHFWIACAGWLAAPRSLVDSRTSIPLDEKLQRVLGTSTTQKQLLFLNFIEVYICIRWETQRTIPFDLYRKL
ncbi:PREDICTED: uncharacterized protein LOC109149617 isoform X2 [Ipomoea nil]|uniref:uncharacterized protein LOC109149617 isoform X2 n=1 Tax=Ipomoea nil TaxID=35883 RepID=UPI0009009987|nr:PREDICTED: uncharacterized protein LOC109149617 isoform X2 [Ipomoea nil]